MQQHHIVIYFYYYIDFPFNLFLFSISSSFILLFFLLSLLINAFDCFGLEQCSLWVQGHLQPILWKIEFEKSLIIQSRLTCKTMTLPQYSLIKSKKCYERFTFIPVTTHGCENCLWATLCFAMFRHFIKMLKVRKFQHFKNYNEFLYSFHSQRDKKWHCGTQLIWTHEDATGETCKISCKRYNWIGILLPLYWITGWASVGMGACWTYCIGTPADWYTIPEAAGAGPKSLKHSI